MKSLVTINKKFWDQKRKYFENCLDYGKKIKEKSMELLDDENVKVIFFGSIARGDYGPNSDIDVLIVSEKLSENWIENRHFRTELRKFIGISSPFQFHLATPSQFENWYKKFIKDEFVII